MSRISWNPGALLFPAPPALVSLGTMERANVFTVAWTGIVNTNPPLTYISVRPERHSYSILKETGEFVLNLTTTPLIRAADFCGVRSGAKLDKWEAMGLHKEPVPHLACPAVAESPFCLECKVRQVLPMGTHDMFLSEIVGVQVDESILDEKGQLRLDWAKMAAFAHGGYYEVGKRLATFGFSVRRVKPANKPRRKRP